MKHHTEDYKETTVKYYLENKEDMRNTCKIFKCKFQSLARWIKTYKNKGNINRKTRKIITLKQHMKLKNLFLTIQKLTA